jgi:N-terminal domain of galactosyltransferase
VASTVAHQARARIQAQNVLILASAPVRSLFGVLIKDVPRYMAALGGAPERYLALCNRDEVLQAAPDGSGYRCEWQWTSDLHAPKVMRRLGARLMGLALRDHPIRLSDAPAECGVKVSFIIGHRGDRRLPHLLKTLESIAAQHDVGIECLVVEQDVEARLRGRLPGWVRHLHTPPPAADMPFCRSWAFNVGARYARGDLLVLHDNDLLLSADYASRSLSRMRAGFDVINLKRFGFYLSEAHTHEIFAGRSRIIDHPPESIVQNLLGGGSVAIARETYMRIGGMDEGFVGWGGEDAEFWERAQTLRVWPYGSLPYVHLWHPAQSGKYQGDNPTLTRYRELSAVDPVKRIERLSATASGAVSGPSGWTRTAVAEQQRPLSLEAGVRAECGVDR